MRTFELPAHTLPGMPEVLQHLSDWITGQIDVCALTTDVFEGVCNGKSVLAHIVSGIEGRQMLAPPFNPYLIQKLRHEFKGIIWHNLIIQSKDQSTSFVGDMPIASLFLKFAHHNHDTQGSSFILGA